MLPIKIAVTASIDEQTHLVSVIATPENAPPCHLTNGKIEGVELRNTRDFPGHIKISNGKFAIEFKHAQSKVGAKAKHSRSAAVFLCELWWERFGKGLMNKNEQAVLLGYSDKRSLRKAVVNAQKALNFHDKTIILQSSEDGRSGVAVAIINERNRHVNENGDLLEISGEGWIWFYGNTDACYDAFNLNIGGGDIN